MDFTTFHSIIAGQLKSSPTTTHGINPSTEKPLYEVPCATENDLNEAVASAQKAFPAWADTAYGRRCELVREYAEAFLALEEDMTELLMREVGKPRALANREVRSSYEGMLETAKLTLPVEKIEDENKVATLHYVPLGIVGAICPWNYPLVLSFSKIAPALIAGNCVIVKPSPYTPYSTLKAIEASMKIFPPGVLQALTGNEQLGPWITAHPDIQKISFTGSIPTGKKIVEVCAKTMKRVTLELGGNDACIVFPDVDIPTTAKAVALAAFKTPICVASKRIYIHASIYTPFLSAMVAFTATLKTGDPFSSNPSPDLGPIQNKMQYEKVLSLIADCRANKLIFATPTPPPTSPSPSPSKEKDNAKKGYFIPPHIISSPPSTSRIVTEEPFGPIVPTQPWTDEEEIIARANDTKTGLGATIWAKDTGRAERMAGRLQVGSVYVNSELRPDSRVFFGGWKESGLGGERGIKGLMGFCAVRAVHVYK